MAIYGNQHTVSATTTYPRSEYITTEVNINDPEITKDNVLTVPLNCMRHLTTLASILMKGTITSALAAATIVNTTMDTDIRFKFWVKSRVQYTIRNQSTDLMRVRIYYCKARQDTNIATSLDDGAPASELNIYHMLSRGFAQNALNGANVLPSNNTFMQTQQFSPYDAVNFIQVFKIFKYRTVNLGPGRMARLGIANKPFDFRIAKYKDVGSGVSTTDWNGFKNTYVWNRFEKFCLFQIDSSPAGIGSAQTNYTRDISHTTPTMILESKFNYLFNNSHEFKTPWVNLETNGFAAGVAANAIVNVEEGLLGEEKDAV